MLLLAPLLLAASVAANPPRVYSNPVEPPAVTGDPSFPPLTILPPESEFMPTLTVPTGTDGDGGDPIPTHSNPSVIITDPADLPTLTDGPVINTPTSLLNSTPGSTSPVVVTPSDTANSQSPDNSSSSETSADASSPGSGGSPTGSKASSTPSTAPNGGAQAQPFANSIVGGLVAFACIVAL